MTLSPHIIYSNQTFLFIINFVCFNFIHLAGRFCVRPFSLDSLRGDEEIVGLAESKVGSTVGDLVVSRLSSEVNRKIIPTSGLTRTEAEEAASTSAILRSKERKQQKSENNTKKNQHDPDLLESQLVSPLCVYNQRNFLSPSRYFSASFRPVFTAITTRISGIFFTAIGKLHSHLNVTPILTIMSNSPSNSAHIANSQPSFAPPSFQTFSCAVTHGVLDKNGSQPHLTHLLAVGTKSDKLEMSLHDPRPSNPESEENPQHRRGRRGADCS